MGRFASLSAVATKPTSSSGGLLGWLTGGGSRLLPPLDFPLAGVILPPSLSDYTEPSKTKITTLPNSVKIASEASADPAASIGLYVDCGPIYETTLSIGATDLLQRMAFKRTRNRSHLRVVREVEAIGGNVEASSSREQMSYTYNALKTYVLEMVELLIDSVRNPIFLDWEVNEEVVLFNHRTLCLKFMHSFKYIRITKITIYILQLHNMKAEISGTIKNPHNFLLDAIHSAGYSSALANPLSAPESAINRLNSIILEEFVAENYIAPQMILVASGVEHDELIFVTEPLLSDLPSVSRPDEPKSVYIGGDYRCQGKSGRTHFAVAFELPSGWHKEKEAIILTMLEVLLRGGGSFSASGPGKGMYSRLYLHVLNEYPQFQSISAFNSIYKNTGTFGIQATTVNHLFSPFGSDFVSQAIDIVVNELISVATPGEVDQVQLDHAKQLTKSAIVINLESRILASEDIGRQFLIYGERKPMDHFLKAVDEVTAKDIASVAQKLLSSPLTMASYGDVINVPSYDSVSSKFQSK
ncbi:mitochondrial-processing peptidase subunit alpha-like [Juglans microcarpa x Juglans regia]|uniref:mitochondrial-processing peptidase subunit alpha-like n=1 Tax=Juglans microcarpa x Juglans regia TaxID=2249226 RepID=UPI001B7F6D79|nr:mitochondrial-processing peptidase subunit alpha-like [Juglans microcarpa x Juglans regia]